MCDVRPHSLGKDFAAFCKMNGFDYTFYDLRHTFATMMIVPISDARIKNMIYTVHGEQVMLDSDLAELYGTETKYLNRAATRNKGRFPEDFRFQLTREEHENLRCQIGTSSDDLRKFAAGGRRYMPYVYTEQGVAMLSSVLRSGTAVGVSVRIMRAFVEMRHFIADNAHMFEQIREVSHRQVEYQTETNARLDDMQRSTDERFERVFDYMEAHEEPRQKVFFEGQVYDAFKLLVSLVRKAKKEIVLIDGYVDAGTLNILAKKQKDVSVTVWTHPKTKLTKRDVETFDAQYPELAVRHTTAFHNRFLILDSAGGYLVGASLKDAGKKSFALVRIEDASIIEAILGKLPEKS